ncbi:TetR/AcrR family transcriptional regulator [Sciscionella marina]|uniref:TetR/AcrR family transcriptional regulator n=1 Tax=Sciscionella marina TaxID=508770 RepID=UPI00036A2733|nr:TetR family transcriptional regulator C-terminal domain-containing protein [Sciscionella marina]
MPKQVDHGERRSQLAEALWRIAERDGFAAVTVRNIAAEAGVSVGRVQHYFASKDELLLFALQWVGEEFGGRITAKVSALPEPRDPREVVRIILTERLPLQQRSRVYVQALITWLGRSAEHPELAGYLLEGTRRLCEYLATQLRQAQRDGRVRARVDASRTAEELLALTDGLSSHLLQNLYTAAEARAVLAERLDQLFEH